MTEKSYRGTTLCLVNLDETPSRPRLTREAAELMPLTSEALIEQSLFGTAQALATQHGKELTRTATDYCVSWQGMLDAKQAHQDTTKGAGETLPLPPDRTQPRKLDSGNGAGPSLAATTGAACALCVGASAAVTGKSASNAWNSACVMLSGEMVLRFSPHSPIGIGIQPAPVRYFIRLTKWATLSGQRLELSACCAGSPARK